MNTKSIDAENVKPNLSLVEFVDKMKVLNIDMSAELNRFGLALNYLIGSDAIPTEVASKEGPYIQQELDVMPDKFVYLYKTLAHYNNLLEMFIGDVSTRDVPVSAAAKR
jgi:hypothetical protein